jgi:hypothetical protein
MSNQVSVHQIKLEAKQLKKQHGIQHSKALEIVSNKHGFQSWHHASQVADSYPTPCPIKFKDKTSFRFMMDRKDSDWDFSGSRKPDYIEDDELFEHVLSYGLKIGLSEQQVCEKLEDLVFLKHKFTIPESPLDAYAIITADFFFPPICLWIDGVEYTSARSTNDDKNLAWQGYSYKTLFEDDDFD